MRNFPKFWYFLPIILLSAMAFLYKDPFYLIIGIIVVALPTISKLKIKKTNKIRLTKINTRLLQLVPVLLIIFVLIYFGKGLISRLPKKNIKIACDEEKTLKKAKACVIPIIRDDDGHGSGFSVKNNFIITNKHVIEGANSLHGKLGNEDISLKVWNYSPTYDIAILKTSQALPTCDWYDSTKLKVAESLHAVGWPLQYTGESTVSKGIFSRMYDYDSINYIQTDTPINFGNSGGPLVSKCGIVGINTIKVAAEGIEGLGFALPSSELTKLVDRLIVEGDEDTEIPIALTDNQATQSFYSNDNNENYTQPAPAGRNIDIETVKTYVSSLYGIRDSWVKSKGKYGLPDQELNALIDSFNRQIDFGETLISRLSQRSATHDDLFMWDSLIKMSYESAAMANRLNGGY